MAKDRVNSLKNPFVISRNVFITFTSVFFCHVFYVINVFNFYCERFFTTMLSFKHLRVIINTGLAETCRDSSAVRTYITHPGCFVAVPDLYRRLHDGERAM